MSEPRPTALGDAEVGDLDAVVVVQEQVRRLDVAMDDSARMRCVERGCRLAEPLERASDRLRALADEPIGERAAREVLHHDVRVILVLADVKDRHRARGGREACCGQRFTGEARADRLVVGVAVGEHLDRDDARQVGVLGAVDLPHPAAGDALGVPGVWVADDCCSR